MKTIVCECGYEAKGRTDQKADTAMRQHAEQVHRDSNPLPQPSNKSV